MSSASRASGQHEQSRVITDAFQPSASLATWQALVPGLGEARFIGLPEILKFAHALLSPCWAPLPFLMLLPACLLLTLGETARRPHETDQVCLSLSLDRCSRCVQIEAAASGSAPYRAPPSGQTIFPCCAGAAGSPAAGSKGMHPGGVFSPMCVLSVSRSWASPFAGPPSTVQEGRHRRVVWTW